MLGFYSLIFVFNFHPLFLLCFINLLSFLLWLNLTYIYNLKIKIFKNQGFLFVNHCLNSGIFKGVALQNCKSFTWDILQSSMASSYRRVQVIPAVCTSIQHSISLSFLNWNGWNLVSRHIFSRCFGIQKFSSPSHVLLEL